MNGAYKGELCLKFKLALIGTIASLAVFASGAASAADKDKDQKSTGFTSDVKAAAKGIKDAAVTVGTQIGTGTKNAYQGAKSKIKKDTKDGKPGDGSIAKKNDAAPTATKGHK
jgi:outer membrane lipoprotein-sorting protein